MLYIILKILKKEKKTDASVDEYIIIINIIIAT